MLNIAMDVLTLICPNITPTNIDVVYRVGNPNVSNRPILVNFTTRSLKEQVMRNKVNLRDKSGDLDEFYCIIIPPRNKGINIYYRER